MNEVGGVGMKSITFFVLVVYKKICIFWSFIYVFVHNLYVGGGGGDYQVHGILFS